MVSAHSGSSTALALLVAAAALSPPPIQAQGTPGPTPERGTPLSLSPEHERIDFLTGEWLTTSQFPDGRVGRGWLSYQWVQEGAWMRVEFHGEHPDQVLWQAQVMQRWDPRTEAYRAWIFPEGSEPLVYQGTSDGPGHFRVEHRPEGGHLSGIDYHRQPDGSVHQENWVQEGDERRVTLRTRYRSTLPPPPATSGAPLPSGASAEDARHPEEEEVLAVVDQLFDAMRARDGAALAAVFHPEARMLVAPVEDQAPEPVSIQTVDAFVASIGAGGEPIHEPYFRPRVRIDGHLAHVWTFYHLYRGEAFSHCGYDSFDLVRTPEGWRVAFVAYTLRRERCGEE